jgi:hypothetical protein
VSQPNPATDPHNWWDNQITLHPPTSEAVTNAMDHVRAGFKELGHTIIAYCPPGPDVTVALRELKAASALAIGAIACDQDHYNAEDGS